jgi:hypothetical protein
MSELVYYPTIDNLYARENSHAYKDIDQECLDQKLDRFIIIDDPTNKRLGEVFAFNSYDKLVYKTTTLEAHLRPQFGISAICPTEVLFYYETSEEIIKSCKIHSNNHIEYSVIGASFITALVGVSIYAFNAYYSTSTPAPAPAPTPAPHTDHLTPIVHSIPVDYMTYTHNTATPYNIQPYNEVIPTVIGEDSNQIILGVARPAEVFIEI